MHRCHIFELGIDGICHPFNLRNFDPARGDCERLLKARGFQVNSELRHLTEHWRLAAESVKCTSVQRCALATLFLHLAGITTPGYTVCPDRRWHRDTFAKALYEAITARARQLRRRELRVLARRLKRELHDNPPKDRVPVAASSITIGMHMDEEGAKGPWRGMTEAWKAFAEVHGHRWILDTKSHFQGQVFAHFLGLHWATTNSSAGEFWNEIPWLKPQPQSTPTDGPIDYPENPWVARVENYSYPEHLLVSDMPPKYWACLEAMVEAISDNEWTVWIDIDFMVSPCCFDTPFFQQIIGHDRGWGLPHVVVRGTAEEDFPHHCANAGFFIVRNSPIGSMFAELARSKRSWPNVLYSDQGVLAESLLELLELERQVSSRSSALAYEGHCLNHLLFLYPYGFQSYGNYCACHRQALIDFDVEHSQWVRVLEPREEAEVGLLIPSLFMHRGAATNVLTGQHEARGTGWLPLRGWSRDRTRSHVDAWMPKEHQFGGPCGLLPPVIHWASVHHKPQLIYDFLATRFPEELPLDLLVNGTSKELAVAYRKAGDTGRAAWQRFVESSEGSQVLDHARSGALTSSWLDSGACGLTSARMWGLGGFRNKGRDTRDTRLDA
ncbi:unnamed protein product [Polarella glacialis]|uniref:Uncharacterized protein n=1 Tax=Polarella glacialis TaxID=89957 RepID=A0A813HL28_POLGL|nr:unnamed protein product [Polarella glacialis]